MAAYIIDQLVSCLVYIENIYILRKSKILYLSYVAYNHVWQKY